MLASQHCPKHLVHVTEFNSDLSLFQMRKLKLTELSALPRSYKE